MVLWFSDSTEERHKTGTASAVFWDEKTLVKELHIQVYVNMKSSCFLSMVKTKQAVQFLSTDVHFILSFSISEKKSDNEYVYV